MKTARKKPEPISLRAVGNLAMVAGNEKKHPLIIHEGQVKQWVGFGWVTERKATAADFKRYPEAK